MDRVFYRPIGYKLARLLAPTGVHPNFITFVSIIVGSPLRCSLLFLRPWWVVLVAIALMIFANILDCVDGQLARLTSIKSKLGRILDGVARVSLVSGTLPSDFFQTFLAWRMDFLPPCTTFYVAMHFKLVLPTTTRHCTSVL